MTTAADYADLHAQAMERFTRWQYCTRAGLDAETTCALVAVVADRFRRQSQLADVAAMLDDGTRMSMDQITVLLAGIFPGLIPCHDCDGPLWDGLATVIGEKSFHESCANKWISCAYCGDATSDDDSCSTADGRVCEHCNNYHYNYCEHCDESFNHGDGHDFDREDEREDEREDCDCESSRRRFTFPANGSGTIANDERLTVTMPTGVIDSEGLKRIAELLTLTTDTVIGLPYSTARGALEDDNPRFDRARFIAACHAGQVRAG